MKGVILPIMFNLKSLAFHPLSNLDRTGDFNTNSFTNLLVPNDFLFFVPNDFPIAREVIDLATGIRNDDNKIFVSSIAQRCDYWNDKVKEANSVLVNLCEKPILYSLTIMI